MTNRNQQSSLFCFLFPNKTEWSFVSFAAVEHRRAAVEAVEARRAVEAVEARRWVVLP